MGYGAVVLTVLWAWAPGRARQAPLGSGPGDAAPGLSLLYVGHPHGLAAQGVLTALHS